jgi:hypothetical protein
MESICAATTAKEMWTAEKRADRLSRVQDMAAFRQQAEEKITMTMMKISENHTVIMRKIYTSTLRWDYLNNWFINNTLLEG